MCLFFMDHINRVLIAFVFTSVHYVTRALINTIQLTVGRILTPLTPLDRISPLLLLRSCITCHCSVDLIPSWRTFKY